jgi:hypothetical protein
MSYNPNRHRRSKPYKRLPLSDEESKGRLTMDDLKITTPDGRVVDLAPSPALFTQETSALSPSKGKQGTPAMTAADLRIAAQGTIWQELSGITDALNREKIRKGDSGMIANDLGEHVQVFTAKEIALATQAYRILFQVRGKEIVDQSMPGTPERYRRLHAQILTKLAGVMETGSYDTVLWSPEIWAKAHENSNEAFSGAVSTPQTFPTRMAFWYMAVSRRFAEHPCVDPEAAPWWTPDWELHTLLFYPSSRITSGQKEPVVFHGGIADAEVEITGNKDAVSMYSLWYNVRDADNPDRKSHGLRLIYEDGVGYGEKIRDGVWCAIAAAQAFLRLPFVASESKQTLNHNDRKIFKKSAQVVPEVRTVVLRKSAPKHPTDGEGAGRNYQGHFMVNPHWRKGKVWTKGPKAGTTGHPEYVHSYVKGDTDKPLIRRTTTVALAKR